MKSLDNQVVVITGAGSGMGREMAVLAAKRGSLLAISDWNPDGLDGTVDLVKSAGVRELRSDVLDVSDRAAMSAYASAVAEQFGRVNMVVNNAGVTVTGDFEDMEYADFDWIVGINFLGVVHGSKEFLPHLIASGDGAVVNISSLFGLTHHIIDQDQYSILVAGVIGSAVVPTLIANAFYLPRHLLPQAVGDDEAQALAEFEEEPVQPEKQLEPTQSI